MFDDTKQVCQVLEYKLYYNENEIGELLVSDEDTHVMTNKEFFRFLDRSLDYASLDLVGMSLILLKKEYAGTRIKLRENRTNVVGNTYGIDGTIWMEPKSTSSLNV